MRTTFKTATAVAVLILGTAAAQAQTATPAAHAAPQQPMSFFVTSANPGKGADLGGLAGADKYCQQLAESAGSKGKTWHAYLSTQGTNAVNARDRIGNGPWYNAKGALIAKDNAELHGDTLELARAGNKISKTTALDEKGQAVNSVGETPLRHDILTGSQADGRTYADAADHTCKNWTSGADGVAQLGHHDRTGSSISWNSAHPSRGCSPEALQGTGSGGLFYCFATN